MCFVNFSAGFKKLCAHWVKLQLQTQYSRASYVMTRAKVIKTSFLRRYLPFLPSLLIGLLGAVWLTFYPFDYGPRAPLWTLGLVALALTVGLLSGAWMLERSLASFRYASGLLERALAQLRPSWLEAILFAALSSSAEELFFRGALQSLVGVWGQALVFGLLHPMPRRGWSYTLYAALSGLAFGFAAALTGSLWPGLIAHFLINLQGLLELRRGQRRSPRV